MIPSRLTDLDLAHAFVCPHWPYWERFGDPQDKRPDDEAHASDLWERLWDETALLRGMVPNGIEAKGATAEERATETLRLMQEGAPGIIHPCLQTDARQGEPTALLRVDGKSALGAYLYVPVDVRRGTHLRKDETFRLFFYADLLRELQGTLPTSLTCLNRDGVALSPDGTESMEEYREFIERTRRTIQGECPEPVYRKGCQDTSPWGAACLKLAASHDDIALLFSISQKQTAGLRAQGIETVHQAAEMDPLQLDGAAPGLTLRGLLRLQKQARSLVDRSVIVREPWPNPSGEAAVFFDIESHPGTDEDYLYGFWIQQKDGSWTSTSLNRFDGTSEQALWERFLAFLPSLPPNYRVYHYGDYEYTRLTALAARYGSSEQPWLMQFLDRLVDVKELVRDCLVLPLFFYSLKTVASFLGYRWREDIRHGRDSIYIYEAWQQTRDPVLATSLIRYNEDDVRGLAHVLTWAKTWAKKEGVYQTPYPWETGSASLESI